MLGILITLVLCYSCHSAVVPYQQSQSLAEINYFTSDSQSLDRNANASSPNERHGATIESESLRPINGRYSYLNPVMGSTPCKAYTIIASRGTGETQTDANGSRNLIAQVFANIPDGEAYEVVYPATFNFLTDPELGAVDMLNYMTFVRQKCPDQKMLLFGYSQGAMVTINCLNAPEMRALQSNVRGIIFTGDPYYRPHQPQDRGTARFGFGIGHIKNVIEPKNSLPVEYASITRDFCNVGDPVCQGIAGLNVKDVLSMTVPAHHYENTPQESELIQFAVQQLRL